MSEKYVAIAQFWSRLGTNFLPFADAASEELPLGRLLRLSLFQISVGMAVVLLTGTLNRVMIVELSVPAWLVALMVSLPLLFAPFRALIGYKSDTYRSYLGVRRTPYLWRGSLLQFGGLAIMPFALLVLSGDVRGGSPVWGQIGAALAFLMVGAGLHTTQTAGLALATDLAKPENRPRVVALLYVMLLVGMGLSALVFGLLLQDFTEVRLIKVIQGAAVATMVLNFVALWKQEARDPHLTRHDAKRPSFQAVWREFNSEGRVPRLLWTVGLGAAAFSMQDVLLEPYGAQVLGLSVSATTVLTAILAAGTLLGFALAARLQARGSDELRVAALGLVMGVPAFSCVIFADPLQSAALFQAGVGLIGFGGGLFAVGTMSAAMAMATNGNSGIAVGAWGAVQATATGGAIALGGIIRDIFDGLARSGALGEALDHAAAGYGIVYHLEILLLFMALAALGPLVRTSGRGVGAAASRKDVKFGLAEFPN
ncbi:MAG: BCD family MFS transporter [Alphaproteobacteria bacterium]|nr:BCD family MFS transporter [Alphaproteobacteria bacterium]